MYVLVNMEYDGDEHAMEVVGVYETWLDAQGAMYDDVKGYVEECEWEEGRWEVCNRQAYAMPPASDEFNQDARGYWAIFDTSKNLRWCSWMLDTNYWTMESER